MEEKKSAKKRKASIYIVLFLLLIVLLVVVVILVKGPSQNAPLDDMEVTEETGERFEYDDFYHAETGTWKLETPIDLLKEQKYVSGKIERAQYLVYPAKIGEIAKIKDSDGRWKLIEIVEGDSVIATGWADLNQREAEKIP